jgi:DNA polymerase I-like protein with 3'-5' exonuclease and polymerase domains
MPDVEQLRIENRKLHNENDELRAQLAETQRELLKLRIPVKELRREIEPLFIKMQAVMGYIELTGVESEAPLASSTNHSGTSSLQPPDAAAWQMWKQRLPGACPKVIDALLIQPLTATQLIAATNTSYSTVQRALDVLKNNGLTEKNGDRVSLKRL